ncbi:MAG TPA: hypothetical protein VK645_15805 [Chitinophagaceae bacterium]|nr:hypothetical protein [Chitinophagaceae bacterium]
MKRNNIYKMVLIPFLMVLAAISFFFYRMYQKDTTSIEHFVASYKKSEKAISGFSIPFFALNLNYTTGLDQDIKIYNQITGSMKMPGASGERKIMVKEAIARNTYLLDQLSKTNESEHKADSAIKELKANAVVLSGLSSLIKNDAELGNTATEIADLCKKEFNNLSAYKRIILKKTNEANEILQNTEEGKASLNLPVTIRTESLDSISKEFKNLNNSTKAAYILFQSLVQ